MHLHHWSCLYLAQGPMSATSNSCEPRVLHQLDRSQDELRYASRPEEDENISRVQELLQPSSHACRRVAAVGKHGERMGVLQAAVEGFAEESKTAGSQLLQSLVTPGMRFPDMQQHLQQLTAATDWDAACASGLIIPAEARLPVCPFSGADPASCLCDLGNFAGHGQQPDGDHSDSCCRISCFAHNCGCAQSQHACECVLDISSSLGHMRRLLLHAARRSVMGSQECGCSREPAQLRTGLLNLLGLPLLRISNIDTVATCPGPKASMYYE